LTEEVKSSIINSYKNKRQGENRCLGWQ